MEDVHNDVHEIEQRPATCRHALDVMRPPAALLDGVLHALGEGAHVDVRRSRRDHEIVGRVADGAQVQYDDVGRLVLVERCDGDAQIAPGVVLYACRVRLAGNGSAASEGVASSTCQKTPQAPRPTCTPRAAVTSLTYVSRGW